MKIVVFNLCFSPNLGDGVIADGLMHGLGALLPRADIQTVDLAGRDGHGAVTVPHRALAIKVLRRLPGPVRQRLVLYKLSRHLDRLEPGWRAVVEGADLAIIGGGQLFSDADLNFPLKVARVAAILAEARVPTAVHAVGVSRNWSRLGGALFNRLFEADLRFVGVRDAPSRAAWLAQARALAPAPSITPDPGLLAAACYGTPVEPAGRIGLGVTAPDILSYHADSPVVGGSGDPGAFFVPLARSLARRPGGVRLFTNGAEEDRAMLARVAAHPDLAADIAAGAVEVAPAPDRPNALAHLVAGCRAVVAHRLHACILARAYQRPAVGLGWDSKVASFFALTEAERFFLGEADTPPEVVAARLDEALAAGIPDDRQAALLERTMGGLADLITAAGFGQALRGPAGAP